MAELGLCVEQTAVIRTHHAVPLKETQLKCKLAVGRLEQNYKTIYS